MPNTLNGWPAVPNTAAGRAQLTPAAGLDRRQLALDGPVALLLAWFCAQFAARVEPIDAAQSWGWAYRKIAGSAKWSNHASGTAVDLNAVKHPQGRRNTFTTAQRKELAAILAEAGGLIRWGDKFSPPDEMHFEIAPRVTASAIRAQLDRLDKAAAPAPLAPGARGDRVERLQAGLMRVFPAYAGPIRSRGGADGIYGTGTAQVVAEFQRRSGLPATGTVDKATSTRLALYGITTN